MKIIYVLALKRSSLFAYFVVLKCSIENDQFFKHIRSWNWFEKLKTLSKNALCNITCLPSGQSYKAPKIIIYVSRVVHISNLLVSKTLES